MANAFSLLYLLFFDLDVAVMSPRFQNEAKDFGQVMNRDRGMQSTLAQTSTLAFCILHNFDCA